MARQTSYVPILWAKDGEYGALRQLEPSVKAQLTPLLEIPPIPWNYESDSPSKTIDKHLEKTADRIQRAWGADAQVLVDFEWIDPATRMRDGVHPLTHLFGEARTLELRLVPVVTLARDGAYQAAVAAAVRADRQGACLRLQPDDVNERNLGAKILDLLRALGVSVAQADLIIDVRGVGPKVIDATVESVRDTLGLIPRVDGWRSLVLAGTGFPTTLAGMRPLDVTRVARAEWTLWRRLAKQLGHRRIPVFGDYGISSPAPPDVDPRIMKPSASVRYTADDAWVVFKGQNVKDYGYDQFHDVCRRVLRAPEYSGREFSWGDRYIHDCAKRQASRGNLTTWRKVGTCHHLTFVVDQTANAA